MTLTRRALLLAPFALALPHSTRASAFAPVARGRALVFPRDHGAHPDYRIEWWYATGWLDAALGPLGFQITFFRTALALDPANRSRFAPRQVLFAHAALADPRRGRLLHIEHVLRAGFGDAFAAEHDTDVRIGAWRFRREPEGRYRCSIDNPELQMDLVLAPTQPLLLQGDAGWSQKGPDPAQASHYYSQPQLTVEARIALARETIDCRGRAWLDHEWSSTLLDPRAEGWDWIGINLDDGGALMAFRIRAGKGGADLWRTARWRTSADAVSDFAAEAVQFRPLRRWQSPRTRASYPVAMELTLGARRLVLEPLLDDQELDSGASTGVVYWEGAVTLLEQGRRIGRGYLELTGYARRPPL